jgi:RimJ/RimL family protein N-acetyltransferase
VEQSIIETDRLYCRPYRDDDLDILHRLYSDPVVMRYGGPSGPSDDPERARRAMAKLNEHQAEHGFSLWPVIEKTTDAHVGQAGLLHVEGTKPEVEVIYLLFPIWWKRGIATEIARASVRFGFEQCGLETIIGLTFPPNLASQRVLEKLGMQRLGITDRFYGSELVEFTLDRADFSA